jgi:hypothetical protein
MGATFAAMAQYGIMASGFHQTRIGLGFLLVAIGSLWLPNASVAEAYGSLLAMQGADRSLQREKEKKGLHGAERVFLAMFLRRFDVLEKDLQTGLLLLLILALYAKGWLLLGSAGGYPSTLFGLAMMFTIPSSAYLHFEKVTKGADRSEIAESLIGSILTRPVYGGRFGILLLYGITILVIVSLLAGI